MSERCQQIRRWLAELGQPGHDDRTLTAEAVAEHVDRCPRCHEFEAAIAADLLAQNNPVDLTGDILAHTSGSACAAAQGQLCDWVDDALTGLDHTLITEHVADCQPCDNLQLALRQMNQDLPQLAERHPGPGFAERVLAHTSSSAAAQHSPAPLVDRLTAAWRRWLHRPRFGLEAGYVGAVMLWLLFGASFAPLQQVPHQAWEWIQHGSAAAPKASQLPIKLAELGQLGWEGSGAPDALDGLASGWETRVEQTARPRASLSRRAPQLRQAAMHLDLESSADAVTGAGRDLGLIWQRFVTPARVPNEPTETEHDD